MNWYSVRCVFQMKPGIYEERITLWQADTFDSAIAQAEDDAREYTATVGFDAYLGVAQAYFIGDLTPESGDEIFSLLRSSTLDPESYITAFFDTGAERQSEL